MIVPAVTGADSPDWTVAELGRVVFTYRLDPALIASPLKLGQQEAVTIAAGEQPSIGFGPDRQARAALLLNILVRVEIRCGHDAAAIRAALNAGSTCSLVKASPAGCEPVPTSSACASCARRQAPCRWQR